MQKGAQADPPQLALAHPLKLRQTRPIPCPVSAAVATMDLYLDGFTYSRSLSLSRGHSQALARVPLASYSSVRPRLVTLRCDTTTHGSGEYLTNRATKPGETGAVPVTRKR